MAIPITIITGFLGAGKTTLLNSLIVSRPDKKVIVIENEFGEVGIDGALLVDLDAQIFELSNGCICCNLNEDLQETLLKLLEVKTKPDHLIIETTGLADPSPILATLLTDEVIQSAFKIDAVITLVDALHIEQQWEANPQCFNQISLGNFIVLNKIASVPKTDLERLVSIIASLNPLAEVYATNFCEVRDIDLLQLNAYEKQDMYVPEGKSFTFLNNSPYPRKISLRQAEHQDVLSVHVSQDKPLDILKFDHWLKALMGNHFGHILRVKGFVYLEDFESPILIQGVMDMYMSERASDKASVPAQVSSLVFIGRKLNKVLLKQGLALCIADVIEPEMDFEALYKNIEQIQECFLSADGDL